MECIFVNMHQVLKLDSGQNKSTRCSQKFIHQVHLKQHKDT